MKYRGAERRAGRDRRRKDERRRRQRRVEQKSFWVLDEFHFNSVDDVLRRWPDEFWAAKGKPKLWVRVYQDDDVTVWRDVGYGEIKMVTPDGASEGRDIVTVNDFVAVCRRGTLEVRVRRGHQVPSPIDEALLGVKTEETISGYEIKAEIRIEDADPKSASDKSDRDG